MEKVVLITGGNHGIGAATASAFARQGSDVFITFLPQSNTEHKLMLAVAYPMTLMTAESHRSAFCREQPGDGPPYG